MPCVLSCKVRARELSAEMNTQWLIKNISVETLSLRPGREEALDKQGSSKERAGFVRGASCAI